MSEGSEGSALASSVHSRGSAPRAPRAFARFARRKRSVTFEGLRPSSTPRFRSLRSTKALSYVRGAPPLEHPALSLASLDESAQLRSRGSAPRAPRAFARFARRKRSVRRRRRRRFAAGTRLVLGLRCRSVALATVVIIPLVVVPVALDVDGV